VRRPRPQGATLYRCRKCRGLVATSRQVLPVEAAVGHRMFRAGPYGSTMRRLEEQRRGHPQQGACVCVHVCVCVRVCV